MRRGAVRSRRPGPASWRLPTPFPWRGQATLLTDTVRGIHDRCVEYGLGPGASTVDYVRGANIAGSKKVADAMLAFGVV